MTWDGPYLPVDLTLTTASDPLTWTRSRLECSAWTLTALLAQVVTAIEPPKLFTSRRAPGRRCEPRGLRQRDRDGSRRDGAGAYQPGRAARQDDQGHRRRDELRHGEREVPPRPRRGRAADPHGDLRPEVGSGRPVVERP